MSNVKILLTGARRDSSESTESDEKKDGMVFVKPRSHKSFFDDFGASSSSSSASSDSDEEHPSIWYPFRFRFEGNPFDSFINKMQGMILNFELRL